jgi:phosphoglycolate phosphatase
MLFDPFSQKAVKMRLAQQHDVMFFDLDGTLVETAPEIADATNDALSQLGFPEVDQAQVDAWIGHGTRALLVKALARADGTSIEAVEQSALLQEALPIFNSCYQNRCGTRSRLYPYVADVLERLADSALRMVVLTNKESRYTDLILEHHRLTDYFDMVISGDTFPQKKPDPVGIQHCLSVWDFKPSRALFVGDSSVDAMTARNAGISVWLLPYGYNMGHPVESACPDRVISDLRALLDTEVTAHSHSS